MKLSTIAGRSALGTELTRERKLLKVCASAREAYRDKREIMYKERIIGLRVD